MDISVSKAGLDPEWDSFLETLPDNLYQQSSMWARVKEGLGWKNLRVVVRDRDRILGGVSILLRRLPLLGYAGYVSKGPVVASSDPKIQDFILDQIDRIAIREQVLFLKVQPACGMDSLFNRLAERGALPSAISVTPLATLRVDLTPDTDEILARMNKYTRRNISRAERKNLSCRLGQESDITAFNALAKIHGRRCGYTFFPDDYYYNLWSTLAPKGHFCFFVAEYQGQIIAANSYIIFGDTILDYHLVDNGLHKELNAATLLQWEGMLWGKKHGCSWYDFGGIKMLPARALMNNRPLPDTREGRLAKFKKSFGSQLMLRPGVFDVSLVPPKRLTVLLVPSLIKMKPLLNFLLGHSLSGFVRMHDKAIREEAALLDL